MAKQTIEQTGKGWKVFQLISGIAIALGLAGILFKGSMLAAFLALAGCLALLIGYLGAWWQHG